MSDPTDVWAQIHSQHPAVGEAVRADAAVALAHRGEPLSPGSGWGAAAQIARLALVSDAFLAQALYRVKARLQTLGIPLLPRLAHRLAMVMAGVSIGDPVVVDPGVYIMHGQVIIDGLVRIGRGVVIGPFVTVGLRAGNFRGPTIEEDVHIGAGATIIGPIRVGAGAVIGAGAVVVDDVPGGVTVAGVPARAL